MDHNPFLKPAASGARGGIEKRENIEWQHRAEAPGEFENRLGDVLEQAFGKGIDTLPDLVNELNAAGSRDRSGNAWTEESFQAEMRRLGG
jgi:hypothetical protein